ncbi:MAG: phosphoglycerate dehydrogenase-like enzyme [Gammaproteobacteria bacterium]|jgi:phosphoglycerate dehydrogenase-like enzyme
MTAKIVFVAPFPDSVNVAKEMAPAGFDLVIAAKDSPEYDAAIVDAEYLVGFVAGLIQEDLYAKASKLKLIQLLSAGYDEADIAAARRAMIPISNNGGANSVAVSEHAILLMLAVQRQLLWQHKSVSAGQWRGNQTPKVFEMRDKTVGIIGLGSIGKKTARIAAAFGANVIYYDTDRLTEAEEDALGVRFRLRDELLRTADVVSLHVPLNETTRHMIGREELGLLKSSAILVNTSRGPVIDEVALHAVLAAGSILGAGLDVFDEEPPPQDNPLFSLDNVVLTAHLAGPTFESHTARVRNGFDNVQRVARGEAPLWVIPELD